MKAPQLVYTDELALTVASQSEGWQLHTIGNAIVIHYHPGITNTLTSACAYTHVLHCGSLDFDGEIEGTATFEAVCPIVYRIKAVCGENHLAVMNAMLLLMQTQV